LTDSPQFLFLSAQLSPRLGFFLSGVAAGCQSSAFPSAPECWPEPADCTVNALRSRAVLSLFSPAPHAVQAQGKLAHPP